MILAPCHTCGRPAFVGEGPGNTWEIGCFRDDCACRPVPYRDGDKRSRAAAVRVWNARWHRKKAREIRRAQAREASRADACEVSRGEAE